MLNTSRSLLLVLGKDSRGFKSAISLIAALKAAVEKWRSVVEETQGRVVEIMRDDKTRADVAKSAAAIMYARAYRDEFATD